MIEYSLWHEKAWLSQASQCTELVCWGERRYFAKEMSRSPEGKNRDVNPLPWEGQCYYNLSGQWGGPNRSLLVREEGKAPERKLQGAKGKSPGGPSSPASLVRRRGFEQKPANMIIN